MITPMYIKLNLIKMVILKIFYKNNNLTESNINIKIKTT